MTRGSERNQPACVRSSKFQVPSRPKRGPFRRFGDFPAMLVAEVQICGTIDLEMRAMDWFSEPDSQPAVSSPQNNLASKHGMDVHSHMGRPNTTTVLPHHFPAPIFLPSFSCPLDSCLPPPSLTLRVMNTTWSAMTANPSNSPFRPIRRCSTWPAHLVRRA